MTQEKLEELARDTAIKVLGESSKIPDAVIDNTDTCKFILVALQTAVAEQRELDAKITEDYIGEYSSHKAICWAIAQAIREGKKGL
jgi:hypothetical protein